MAAVFLHTIRNKFLSACSTFRTLGSSAHIPMIMPPTQAAGIRAELLLFSSKCINPYDETEYHWALKSPGRNHWKIIRNGHAVSTVGAFIGGKPDETAEPLSPEQIAYFLIEADMKAHLEPSICHN